VFDESSQRIRSDFYIRFGWGYYKWWNLWASNNALVFLAYMKGKGDLGVIHGNLCEGSFKCGIPLVMNIVFPLGGVAQRCFVEFWRPRYWVVTVEHCWYRVFVGVRIHSMLVLFWFLTMPLVSKFISLVSVHKRNISFVVSFFNSKGHSLLSTFVKVGIGIFLHASMWFGNPSCYLPQIGMEPTWKDVKKNLCRHEEISQANNMTL